MLPGFFREVPDRATDVGDVGIIGEDGETGEVGDKGLPKDVLQNDVGAEGIDRFLGFGVESGICSSLLAIDADTSTTV